MKGCSRCFAFVGAARRLRVGARSTVGRRVRVLLPNQLNRLYNWDLNCGRAVTRTSDSFLRQSIVNSSSRRVDDIMILRLLFQLMVPNHARTDNFHLSGATEADDPGCKAT